MQINRPCPAYFSEKNKIDGGYFCKSCNKCVMDFRGKSIGEINALKTDDMCGIFTEDQLSARPVMRFPTRMLFTLLGVLSFMGFSVRPVHAQQESIPQQTEQNPLKTDPAGERKVLPDNCPRPALAPVDTEAPEPKRNKRKHQKTYKGRRYVGYF